MANVLLLRNQNAPGARRAAGRSAGATEGARDAQQVDVPPAGQQQKAALANNAGHGVASEVQTLAIPTTTINSHGPPFRNLDPGRE